MTSEDRLVRAFLGLVAFSLAGSLLSRLTGLDPGPIAPAASLLTLACGVAATFATYVRSAPFAPWRLIAAFTLGAGAELVGIATGFPFGRYAYTHAWWPTVQLPFGPFPLCVPFAWLLMAGASCLSFEGRGLQPASVPRALAWSGVTGLVTAGVDLAMEPVMAGPLHYWRWLDHGRLPGGAPIANSLGWWATATLAGLLLRVGVPALRSSGPRWVLGGFVVLIVGLGTIVRG